jgi:hypothetical protein
LSRRLLGGSRLSSSLVLALLRSGEGESGVGANRVGSSSLVRRRRKHHEGPPNLVSELRCRLVFALVVVVVVVASGCGGGGYLWWWWGFLCRAWWV